MKKDDKRKKKIIRIKKKNVSRSDYLVEMFNSTLRRGLDNSKYKLKEFPLLDDDLKKRLSNSYIIDQTPFDIYEVDNYLIVDNEVLSLIIKRGEEIALLYRNGEPVRIYRIDESILPFEEIKSFLEELIDIIKINPELDLGG